MEYREAHRTPVTALIKEDLPTFERPANANSATCVMGNCSIEATPRKNVGFWMKRVFPSFFNFCVCSSNVKNVIIQHQPFA